MVGVRALTFVPYGTDIATVCAASFTEPIALGDAKLNADIDFVELSGLVGATQPKSMDAAITIVARQERTRILILSPLINAKIIHCGTGAPGHGPNGIRWGRDGNTYDYILITLFSIE